MVIQSPFVRWTVENRLTRMHGVRPMYFFLTTEGGKVAAAISYPGENDNVMYRPCHRFIHDYGQRLGLDANLQWTSENALRVWLDVVHNSFVHSSTVGGSLATCGPSAFIFNPSFPEAIALRKWCIANAKKINNLPAENLQRAAQKKPTTDDIISIIRLPTSTEPEYPSVQATVQVVDFNQNFYYLSCSNCNKATYAFGDGSFWRNYCDQKVPPLPRLKFNVEIADQTGSIPATVFAEMSEQLYDITAAEMVNNTTDGNCRLK